MNVFMQTSPSESERIAIAEFAVFKIQCIRFRMEWMDECVQSNNFANNREVLFVQIYFELWPVSVNENDGRAVLPEIIQIGLFAFPFDDTILICFNEIYFPLTKNSANGFFHAFHSSPLPPLQRMPSC